MEREENKTNRSVFIVALLCTCLLGISIAYAVLSTTLTVTLSQMSQQALTWNVGFQTGTVTGTRGGTDGGSASLVCGDATVTANSVTVANTTLATLHDKCTYHLIVLNTGSVDAELSTVTAVEPPSATCTENGATMVCDNTTYKLTTDAAGQSLLTTGGTLVATTGTLDVYLIVEYTGESTGGTNADQNNGGFTLIYSQK
ncbi:MAG: hypothetical protein IJI60_01875 [Bacilli bacterium]|nr:hypothetical protein [Bacilli bacterium]